MTNTKKPETDDSVSLKSICASMKVDPKEARGDGFIVISGSVGQSTISEMRPQQYHWALHFFCT